MKNKILKAATTLPFWIPFPFIFLAVDYYLNDEQSWIAIAVAALIGPLSITYVSLNKTKEMFAGSAVGAVISIIITSIINNSFDEVWFKPLTSMSYVVVLAVGVLIIQLFAVLIEKTAQKIKNKIKK